MTERTSVRAKISSRRDRLRQVGAPTGRAGDGRLDGVLADDIGSNHDAPRHLVNWIAILIVAIRDLVGRHIRSERAVGQRSQ